MRDNEDFAVLNKILLESEKISIGKDGVVKQHTHGLISFLFLCLIKIKHILGLNLRYFMKLAPALPSSSKSY